MGGKACSAAGPAGCLGALLSHAAMPLHACARCLGLIVEPCAQPGRASDLYLASPRDRGDRGRHAHSLLAGHMHVRPTALPQPSALPHTYIAGTATPQSACLRQGSPRPGNHNNSQHDTPRAACELWWPGIGRPHCPRGQPCGAECQRGPGLRSPRPQRWWWCPTAPGWLFWPSWGPAWWPCWALSRHHPPSPPHPAVGVVS